MHYSVVYSERDTDTTYAFIMWVTYSVLLDFAKQQSTVAKVVHGFT